MLTDEKLIALQFYRTIVSALWTEGISHVIIDLSEDGEMQANVVMKENPETGSSGSKKRIPKS